MRNEKEHGVGLTDEELRFLEKYRKIPKEYQQIVQMVLEGFIKDPVNKESDTI